MSPGQLLVFWCVIGGLVVDVLVEWWRWRHAGNERGLGARPNARLREELERHHDD